MAPASKRNSRVSPHSSETPSAAASHKDFLPGAAFCLMGLVLSTLFFMAIVMRVDLFDSFSNYLNARGAVTGDITPYYHVRPPFLTITLAPFFWINEITGAGLWTGIILSRLFSVAFFGALLWITWKLFLLHLGKAEALLGTLLLALNRLMIHQAPFTKEDIPGVFFITAGYYCYFRARNHKGYKYWIFACLSLIGAVNSRFNVVPPLFLTLFLYELLSGATTVKLSPKTGAAFKSPDFFRKILFLGVIPCLSFIVVPAVLYTLIGVAPFERAAAKFLNERAVHYGLLKDVMIPIGRSLLLNAAFLVKSLTWPVAVCAVLGVFDAMRRRLPGAGFYALWFGIFAGVQIFMIRHIESRYQFPFYVPCYYFAACGLRWLTEMLARQISKFRPSLSTNAAAAIMTVMLLAVPVKEGLGELIRFADPFYRTDFQGKVSEYAGRLAEENDVRWIGGMYSLHPKDYVFHWDDTFTYMYHFYNHTARYFTKKRVTVYAGAQVVAPENARYGLFVLNVRDIARDGDVLIVNPEDTNYNTRTLPPELPPLLVQKVRILPFYKTEETAGFQRFMRREMPGAKIDILPVDEGLRFRGEGIPDGIYELSVNTEDRSDPQTITLVKTVDQKFDFVKKGRTGKIQLIALVYHETITPFFHPE